MQLTKRLVDVTAMKVGKLSFDSATRSIYTTDAPTCDPNSNLVVLSQSRHADMTMYLVAAKSFATFVKPKCFVIIDDGLTTKDRQTLQFHLGTVRFIKTADVDVGSCPSRGTWERLISISRLCAENYVIQLDSDTVTVSEPTEVLMCIEANRSFTLGTYLGRHIVPLPQASSFAQGMDGTIVQTLAERALASLPDSQSKGYVRGCSGFAGFGRNAITIEDVERFSRAMEERLGRDVWREWGSEQVTSNYLVANTREPLVLPVERYPYWAPDRDLSDARLIHFIGYHRFHGREYVRQAQAIIRTM